LVSLEAHLKKYGTKSYPIDNSIRLLGRKFTLHILRNMILLKQKRFAEFLDSIEEISTKTLSIRLKEMEKEGFIIRVVISDKPLQTEYYVTEKGRMMESLLEFIVEFSMKYEPQVIFEDGKQHDMDGLFGKKIRFSCLYGY
jgi:DNA-binding HxlR family transcriptional regulator